MPPPNVAIHVTIPGTVVEGFNLFGYNIGILVGADNVRIRNGKISGMRTSGGNGAGIVVENSSVNCSIENVEVDGAGALADSAAICWTSGTSFGRMRNCHIHNHPKVGMSIGSTTYNEFGYILPASYSHDIQDCIFEHCGYGGSEGDSSSGIAIVGQSNSILIKNCILRYNAGAGIAASGSLIGDGSLQAAALVESPTNLSLDGNSFIYNGEEGLRLKGTNYPRIVRNYAYENSQRTYRGYKNYNYVILGVGADLRGLYEKDNESYGSQPIQTP